MRCLNCRQDGIAPEAEVCPHCGVYLLSLMRDLLPPGTLLDGNKYRVDYALGRGGFGITYQAFDLNLERPVAIKEFFPQEYVHRDRATGRLTVPKVDVDAYQRWLQRFEREGRILARLTHPGIVKVHALFKERETAYLVMELLQGQTLMDELNAQPGKCLPEARVVEIMSVLVAALDTVHREGVYHLDLKPDNVMITRDGRIILVDFGAARQDLGSLTSSGGRKSTTAYTPDYAPLELLGGETVGAESDLFELGMMLHEMLIGTRPPSVLNRLSQEIWEPQNLSEPWRGMLTQALRLQREHRPSQVQQWWQTYASSTMSQGEVAAVTRPSPERKVIPPQREDTPTVLAQQPPPIEQPRQTIAEPYARVDPPNQGATVSAHSQAEQYRREQQDAEELKRQEAEARTRVREVREHSGTLNTRQVKAIPSRYFLSRWLGASCLSVLLGFLSLIAFPLWRVIRLNALLGGWFVGVTVLVIAQFLILRRYFDRAELWIIANVLGGIFALFVCSTLFKPVLTATGYYSSSKVIGGVVGGAIIGAIGGAILGGLQGLVLTKILALDLKGLPSWVLATTVGGAIILPVSFLMVLSIKIGLVAGLRVGSAAGCLLLGIWQGYLLDAMVLRRK